jgi:hypothetical protein
MGIPRIIYLYWDGGESKLPLLEKACLRRIRQVSPSYSVMLLDSGSLGPLPNGFHALSPQHKADWARVSKIAETGGVWMDITCVLLKPVDTWIDMDSDDFHGFRVPSKCADVVENWAFAAPANCALVMLWRDEFRTAIEVGFNKYIAANPPPACFKRHLPYLSQHLALHVTRTKLPSEPTVIHDSSEGPFLLHELCDWSMCQHFHALQLPDIPLVKLRGTDQKNLSVSNLSHLEQTLGVRIDNKWSHISTGMVFFHVFVILVSCCLFIRIRIYNR